jgi:outer membrane protein OmpA-like peptidoglycan-associated protein
MRFSLLIFLFLLAKNSFSQQFPVTATNADCISPIVMTDTIYGPTNAPISAGNTMEFTDILGSLYSFEKEHHTVWFKFTAPETSTLTLDIIPLNSKDDYDFLLFKNNNENNFCQQIKDKTLKPIRTAISRNDKNIQSKTGLKEGAIAEFIHSGPGESYAKPLSVVKGDTYLLVVDNVYTNGDGFTLMLHYKYSKPTTAMLNISLQDSVTGEMITGKIELKDISNPDFSPPQYKATNVSSYFLPVGMSKDIEISCTSTGYFTNKVSITTPDKAETKNVIVKLQKITEGTHLVIENIYFVGNSAEFLPVSDPALFSLQNTMIENPDLKIEVQGHVNWPYGYGLSPDTAYTMKLSRDRAKAVCDFLIEKNISPDRLTYRGFGNNAMVYPYAKTEEEMRMNRRVEILVISNN